MRRYNQSEIEEVATVLKNDGVISVPTDTVYGICARINSSNAYLKLVSVKNRPSTKSFPVLCKDLEQIKSIAGFKHLQNIKTVETIEKWLFFCQIFIFYLA